MAVIQLINPKRSAQAATNKQYGTLINALQQNMTNLRNQNAQNLTDIKDWYNTAATADQAGQTADTAAANAAQTDHSHTVNAVLAALGGNSMAAGLIGSQAVNSGDLMANLAANRQHQDAAQLTNLDATRASALTNQQNAGNTALQQLRSQLQSTLAERGNAYVTNLDAARQMRLQQAAEMQNMALANKQFGLNSKIANAQLNNMNAQTAGLVQQLKHAAPGAASNKPKWNAVGVSDREHLASVLGQMMYTAKKGAVTNPVQAWVKAANALRVENEKWDVQNHPQLRKWLSQLWLSYVDDYNQQHPKNPYSAKANGTPYALWGSPGNKHPDGTPPGTTRTKGHPHG